MTEQREGSAWEVLGAFLRLGLTSFGGPVAHLGYFKSELVERRRWLDEASYADTLALCQFLPGPSSSQVAMCLGALRAGPAGGLAAWLGFSLPSALALMAFAYGVAFTNLDHAPWLHGMKVVAVAVVAQAVWSMAVRLCPDGPRAALALVAALLCLALPSAGGQLLAILGGALFGWRWLASGSSSATPAGSFRLSRGIGYAALLAFFCLQLLSFQVLASPAAESTNILAAFYRTGSLVFGGGHVILPLLQQALCPPGWVTTDFFLAGYGAAQAVPGPLFSLAAYLGVGMQAWDRSWVGGLLCLLAIYLPSFLLLLGVLPYWENLRRRPGVQSALRGVNAAVVGLLLAALYTPVGTSAIHNFSDLLAALLALLALTRARVPAWLVVLVGALIAQGLG